MIDKQGTRAITLCTFSGANTTGLRRSWKATIEIILAALAVSPVLLWAQRSHAPEVRASEAAKVFSVECAGCHGADARGTDQGPALAGARDLRRRSVLWIRHVISNGIPSGGMPAFVLPAGELNALAAFVHSLNSPAAESAVPGDRSAGERYFVGQGKCSSCHMVNGKGRAVGPDLSDMANRLSADELRTSLLNPSARITPGYELVTVLLRNGKTVRGFARSRSNFEIVVQDLKGQFHLLMMNEASAIQEEKRSLMPPTNAGPAELQDLIAYLSRLTGIKPGVSDVTSRPEPRGVSWLRILHPRPGDWLTYNGKVNGNRYSGLTQINARNVKQLRLQ